MIKTTSFSKNRLTKVTWQKDLSENNTPHWNDWTFTSLMPWCFSANTVEETLKAAHQLKFTGLPLESLTSLEDGSFLMTYKYGTLRVVLEQDAYVPRHKSNEDFLEEQDCMWHDWE
jgi:hypothetical protein